LYFANSSNIRHNRKASRSDKSNEAFTLITKIHRIKTDRNGKETNMENIAVVHHTIQGIEVCHRKEDGYFNATSMCKASKKQWYDFYRLVSTKDFIAVLSTETGIPVLLLVETKPRSLYNEKGTWVHPQIAIYLAQWLSPEFAVKVSQWVFNWIGLGYKKKQDILQKDTDSSLKLDDILDAVKPLQKTVVEIVHTEQGELISIDKLEPQEEKISHKKSTVLSNPSWRLILETLFEEIVKGNIPEKIRQNMLISKETITSSKGENERHLCLFFRASNVMAFFREMPRCFDLINESNLNTAQDLVEEFTTAGILAFEGKIKEKGIPIDPKIPSEIRRVSHLVAIDLVLLERDYGIVLLGSKGIVKIP